MSSEGRSFTGVALAFASFGAGTYHGFCDARGIKIEKENLEAILTYGPTILQAGIFGIFGGFAGAIGGSMIGANSDGNAIERSAKTFGGGVAGLALGSAVGAGTGAFLGAFQTLLGYGIGYVAGYAVN